eukprot:4092718-Pleurochrysis_carterae.AAC.1
MSYLVVHVFQPSPTRLPVCERFRCARTGACARRQDKSLDGDHPSHVYPGRPAAAIIFVRFDLRRQDASPAPACLHGQSNHSCWTGKLSGHFPAYLISLS